MAKRTTRKAILVSVTFIWILILASPSIVYYYVTVREPISKDVFSSDTELPIAGSLSVVNKSRILHVKGQGRLGNRMFQYAAIVGISEKYNFTPCINSNDALASVFQLSHASTVLQHPNFNVHSEKDGGIYDPLLEVINSNSSWIMAGYYQSWKYFTGFENLVRKEFTFRRDIQTQVKETLQKYSHIIKNRTKIGVHIRRGDMERSLALRKQGYTVAPDSYFRTAMEYFRQKFTDPVFIVCSDGVSSQVVGTAEDIIHIHGNTGTDIATLASCDHNIISTGSYGWWGAWLAGGHTVYYRNFPRAGSSLASHYKSEDYYPPSWIAMD